MPLSQLRQRERFILAKEYRAIDLKTDEVILSDGGSHQNHANSRVANGRDIRGSQIGEKDF